MIMRAWTGSWKRKRCAITCLEQVPEWLEDLSEADFDFLEELADLEDDPDAASQRAVFYLEIVCSNLEAASIDHYDIKCYLGLLDKTRRPMAVFPAEVLSEENLRRMRELAQSAA